MPKKIRIKQLCLDFLDLIKFIFPKNSGEFGVFVFFFLFYLSYSLIIILKTYLIDYPDSYSGDIFFSFDTPPYFYRGFQNIEGHPLLSYLHMPVSLVGNFFDAYVGYKGRAVAMCVVCNLTIAISCMYIYRYLQQVLQLNGYPLIAFTVFFGCMSTNMMLAFTPESFTTSTFLLTYAVCYFSIKIKNDKEIPFINSILITIVLGGATITNFAKGVIMMWFEKGKRNHIFKKIVAASLAFSACLVYIVLTKEKILFKITNKVVEFTNLPTEASFFEKTIDYFFGSPIFWPHIIWTHHPMNPNLAGWIVGDVYRHWWQYLFVFSLLALLIVSFVRNRNQKLVQMLGLLFLFDVFLHIVLRFGISEAFIYGAHWIYIVPLTIAWLYKSFDHKGQKIVIALFSIMLVMMIANNFNEMYNFIALALDHYSVSTLMKEVGRVHIGIH